DPARARRGAGARPRAEPRPRLPARHAGRGRARVHRRRSGPAAARRVSDVEVAVVGAGAAGLAAASALRAGGREVVVLEASARAGGSAQTEARAGYLFERGPNAFRLGPGTLAFLRAAGLEARLCAASPASRERFLLRGGRLVPVPMSPVALARTPLLSGRGKLRLLAEPFVARGDGRGESVAQFA